MATATMFDTVYDAEDVGQDQWRDLPHQLPQNRGRYSLARAIRKLGEPSGKGAVDGLELETHQEIARRTGRGVGGGPGFFLPLDLPVREHRNLTAATGAGSITNLMPPTILDVLRGKMVCARLGAQFMPGLTGGGFQWGRKSATVSVGWLGEGATPAQSSSFVSGSTDFLRFKPNTTGAYTDFTRFAQDLIPACETKVIDDLTRAIAVEVDRVALSGDGVSNQPLGIAQDPAVAIPVSLGTNGGAPTYAAAVALEQALGNANADVGSLGWVTTPNGRAKLRQTAQLAGGTLPLWDGNEMLGHPAEATTLLPSTMVKGSGTGLSPLILADWSQLLIGSWGAVTIIRNPFLQSLTGVTRITALLDLDVQMAHAASFVQLVDMITT